MVSIQKVTRTSIAHGLGACAALTLLLAAGCQSAPPKAEAEEAAPAPVASATQAVQPHDNAIEAALANAPADPAAAVAPATSPVLNPSAPLSYTVKRGDTLWDISAMYLRDPWLWPEIWHVNPKVQNPHLIYPGDVLTLGYGADGRPQVTVSQGSALRVQPLVRSTPLDGPIATIPFEAIRAFLGKPGLVTRDDIRNSPQVVAMRDRHVVAGEGQEIYAKGLEKKGPGAYAVVQIGEELVDPENGKVRGFMGVYTGTAQFDSVAKVSKGVLTDSARETNAGDLLFTVDMDAAQTDIIPHAPADDLSGQIMAVVDGVALIGQYQVVAVNRGTKHGMERGHVLAIDQKGEKVYNTSCRGRDGKKNWCMGDLVQLPDERAGTLLIFKTYQDVSYGLVVNATVPVRVADIVRKP